ncbi:MAG TPA: hypothetical protein PKE58_07265 [Acidobacteriota bacterium]|nr:hypothetical protein [Acidobacteriota bacterium]
MAQVSPKHFYKVNMRTFSLSEILHYQPNLNGFLSWFLNVVGIQVLPTFDLKVPLPVRADSFFCEPGELSHQGKEIISPLVESFERLGFAVMGYEKNTGIDPNCLDAAGCHLLHQNSKYTASVLFLHSVEAPEPHFVTLNISCLDSEHHSFSVHNHSLAFDFFAAKTLKSTCTVVQTRSPFELFREFESKVQHRLNFSTLQFIRNPHHFAQLTEARSETVLNEGLRLGRFIPMTEIEVQELKRKHSWRYAQA